MTLFSNPFTILYLFILIILFTFTIFLCRFRYFLSLSQSDFKLHIKKIQDPARFDSLTGLYHIHEYYRMLKRSLTDSPYNDWMISVIDCDNFREVNIRYGNETGDFILQSIASELRDSLPATITIGRTGSSFYITSCIPDQETIKKLYDVLARKYREEYNIHLLYCFAQWKLDGHTYSELIKAIEYRLWELKRDIWTMVEDDTFQSERLMTIGELAAGMAHEIRNPLTIIRGFMQLAQQQKLDLNKYFSILIEEVDRMNSIVGEFLQYTRKIDNEHTQIAQLNHCVQQSMMLVESLAIRNGHTIHLNLCLNDTSVKMDPRKMKQVIVNLVQNAFDAMDEKGHVYISTETERTNVWLHIRDTGKGIEENELDHIFRPFYTTKPLGTGLGLALCKKIIEQHNGCIQVTSELNKGTTFSICIPACTSL